MSAVSRPVFVEDTLKVGVWGSGASDEREIDIKWSEEKTRILSARVRYVADTDAGLPVAYRVYLDDRKVVDETMDGYTFPKHVEGSQDITTLLANGTNKFRVVTVKGWMWVMSYTLKTSVYLDIEYEGEPPSIGLPRKPFPWEKVREYAQVAVIGATVVGGVALATSIIFVPEKPWREHLKNTAIGAAGGAALAMGLKHVFFP